MSTIRVVQGTKVRIMVSEKTPDGGRREWRELPIPVDKISIERADKIAEAHAKDHPDDDIKVLVERRLIETEIVSWVHNGEAVTP